MIVRALLGLALLGSAPASAQMTFSAPSSGSIILCRGGAAVTLPANDTNENTAASCAIPANALGANGQLEIVTLWTTTNSANTKTLRVKLGTTAFLAVAATTALTAQNYTRIVNRNSAASQVSYNSGNVSGYGSTTGAISTGTVDTTQAQTLTITGQKATGSETITLESYLVKLLPKG